jgi:hypothetical protein
MMDAATLASAGMSVMVAYVSRAWRAKGRAAYPARFHELAEFSASRAAASCTRNCGVTPIRHIGWPAVAASRMATARSRELSRYIAYYWHAARRHVRIFQTCR